MEFRSLPKLAPGDKVAILSPSYAGPARWPEVYQLGLERIRNIFGLNPVEFPTTSKLGASTEERSNDLIAAFEDPEIKAVITSLGGNDQVTYVRNLPSEPFANNPKPVFGYSDNTHLINHLWLNGVPSYYGGAVLTQFAMHGAMNDFTIKYLKHALFDNGEFELEHSEQYNDIGLNWNDPENLHKERIFEKNEPWHWDGDADAVGVSWGGCVESIDELLRHDIELPTLEQFSEVIMFAETSEEIPSYDYVFRVFRALGERGILERINALLVGRPKAWEFNKPQSTEEKSKYREQQRDTIIEIVRNYNKDIPIIQNLDFGHTDPQICLPVGKEIRIDASSNKIKAVF